MARNRVAKYLPRLRALLAEAERSGDPAATQLSRICAAVEQDRTELLRLVPPSPSSTGCTRPRLRAFAIDDVYAKVPEPLPGLVELTYDRFYRPAVRFLEAALYAGPL